MRLIQPFGVQEGDLRNLQRFDREIQLKAPNQEKRLEILTRLLKDIPVEADLENLSAITIGYVTADIVSLVRESCLLAANTNSPALTDFTFMKAFEVLGTPSMLRSSQISLEKLEWSCVGGMESVKRILKQAVEWPVLHKEVFSRLGLKAPRGILLYGPPGCSKTTLAKILASQTGLAFFSLNGAAIYSSAVGESEASIRILFNTARSCSPCIIFFDEIDALVGKRGSKSTGDTVQERILSTLLNEMDGIENSPGVLVMGATNRPDMVDSALLRPGRFDKVVYVPPPNTQERLEILNIYTKGMPLADNVDLKGISKITVDCTGADLKGICREAALITLRINHQAVSQKVPQESFLLALKERSPTLSQEMLDQYEEFSKLF
jgi:transitional endoplasmic reticulum ATPase